MSLATDFAAKIQVSLTAVADNASTFTGATTLLTTGAAVAAGLLDADAQINWLLAQLAQAREVRAMKFDEANDFYEEFVRYVDNIAKGDASLILLAGMDVALPPGPPPTMTKVLSHVLDPGGTEGSAKAGWKAVYGARYYDVQISTNPNDPASWTDYESTATVRLTLTGLTSGQKIWTRVRAANTVGHGPWSDPACAMVP